MFLISNFRRVLNAVRCLLGNSPASEFYMTTFRNSLFHLHRQVGMKIPGNYPEESIQQFSSYSRLQPIIFYICFLGLLASVTDGSWPCVVKLIC